MKQTLDLLIPVLWKPRDNQNSIYPKSSLRNSLGSIPIPKEPLIKPTVTLVSPLNLAIAEIAISKTTQSIDTPKISSSPIIHEFQSISSNTWQLLDQQMQSCDKCQLCNGRTHVVIDKGGRKAKWLFIGDSPNEQDDLQGIPFTGAAGQLLAKMIVAMNLDIEQDVYITNLVKCRPPKNRHPAEPEINQCKEYLLNQIKLLQPQIIITLGSLPAQALLNSTLAISKLRNQVHQFAGIPLIATYHPAYLIRVPSEKRDAWQDLQLALKVFSGTD